MLRSTSSVVEAAPNELLMVKSSLFSTTPYHRTL
jgi:hypothetical protein